MCRTYSLIIIYDVFKGKEVNIAQIKENGRIFSEIPYKTSMDMETKINQVMQNAACTIPECINDKDMIIAPSLRSYLTIETYKIFKENEINVRYD